MRDQGDFESTHFSIIQRACQGDRKDLGALFRQYEPPLRAHLEFRRNVSPSESEDILQSFFVKKILEGKLLASFDPKKGRFRTYLCTSLNNFCTDLYRKRGINTQSLDEREPPDSAPLDVFEVAYARQVALQVLAAVRTDCASHGQERHWRVFEERFVVPVCAGGASRPFSTLAEELGFESVLQTTNALETVRRKFTRIRQKVIADFVPQADQNTEFNALHEILIEAGKELSLPLRNYLSEQSETHTNPIERLGPTGLSTVLNRIEQPEPPDYGTFEDELADVMKTPMDFGRSPEDDTPTFGDILQNPSPSLELLEQTKREFKRIGRSENEIVSPDMARCIYLCCNFAAIARLGRRITTLSDSDLRTGLTWIRSLGVPGWLETLLRDAASAIDSPDS